MCIQGPTNYDDSTLTTTDLLSIKILCGAGYYGYAYPSSGSISSTIYHYFDTIVSYSINEGSALQDYGNDFRSLGIISDQIVVEIQGSGPNIQHATTRHRYTYKNIEYTISLSQINYIQRDGRRTKIVTKKKEYFQNISISNIKDILPNLLITIIMLLLCKVAKLTENYKKYMLLTGTILNVMFYVEMVS